MTQMLRLHRVVELDPSQDLRREIGDARDADFLAFGQGVADPQAAVVGDADDVAGPGLLGEVALAGGEENTGPVPTSAARCARSSISCRAGKRPDAIRTKAMRSRCCGFDNWPAP